jgi:hypothetical protein
VPDDQRVVPAVHDGVHASSILLEAADIVAGARNGTHGDKERSFDVIAQFWEVYLNAIPGNNVQIRPQDVAELMSLLKKGRKLCGQPVRDHYVDDAGYAAIAGELANG